MTSDMLARAFISALSPTVAVHGGTFGAFTTEADLVGHLLSGTNHWRAGLLVEGEDVDDEQTAQERGLCDFSIRVFVQHSEGPTMEPGAGTYTEDDLHEANLLARCDWLRQQMHLVRLLRAGQPAEDIDHETGLRYLGRQGYNPAVAVGLRTYVLTWRLRGNLDMPNAQTPLIPVDVMGGDPHAAPWIMAASAGDTPGEYDLFLAAAAPNPEGYLIFGARHALAAPVMLEAVAALGEQTVLTPWPDGVALWAAPSIDNVAGPMSQQALVGDGWRPAPAAVSIEGDGMGSVTVQWSTTAPRCEVYYRPVGEPLWSYAGPYEMGTATITGLVGAYEFGIVEAAAGPDEYTDAVSGFSYPLYYTITLT